MEHPPSSTILSPGIIAPDFTLVPSLEKPFASPTSAANP